MSKKKVLVLGVIVIMIIGFLVFRPGGQKIASTSPIEPAKKAEPSLTFLPYTDPSGFSFNYPDNLSIAKNDTDDKTYADITLSSKDVNGSLNLKITDSKYTGLNDWLKVSSSSAKEAPTEKKLGSLKAMEIKTEDRLILGAIDQGIFFTIEMPRIEEAFWMKVYAKVLADFSFVSPTSTTSQDSGNSSSGVTFEGEDVVE